jgi:hypothetical protein
MKKADDFIRYTRANELLLMNQYKTLAIWTKNLRILTDHAGMRRESGSPKSLIKRIEKCIQDIKDLPMQTAVQANDT